MATINTAVLGDVEHLEIGFRQARGSRSLGELDGPGEGEWSLTLRQDH